ncbi:MAG: endonuclease MutS2 [Tissierellia bacterium]|nr:endonuclease MutS2 [Tissierellia bacterium]
MQEESLKILEFDKILENLQNKARSNIVKEELGKIRPSTDIYFINKELDYTKDMIDTMEETGNFDIFGLYDFNDIIVYIRKKGILTPQELLKVADFLRVSEYLKEFYPKIEKESIKDLFYRLDTNEFLRKEIERSIISDDEINDNASSNLRSIRRRKDRKEEEIKQKLNYYKQSSKFDDILQDRVVTIRDGRYVVPVRSEKKQSLKGIIHDRSQSGQTIFVEPIAIVELNNDLRDLELKEQEEIRRILDRLSRLTEAFDVEILNNQDIITRIDYLQSKAKFAIENEYTMPIVNNDKIIDLKNARHPLLGENVVPINVKIGKDYTTLIITGPNTGGKTVSLKTVGLLTVMAQSGLYIPADKNSVINVFDDVFLDIGDTQSIEMSLSTFSASLTNIVKILRNASENSLILLDEIGAGTDPSEGAALAISILEYIKKRGILTFATTHYSELKYYAVEEDKVMNASVEFDVDTLSPTYKLIIGTPGKSNAFEISERLGLNLEILENAKSLMGDDDRNINKILQKIEDNRKEIESKNKEIQIYKDKLEKESKILDQKIKILEDKRDEIIKLAEQKAQKILDKAKDQSDQMLKTAKKTRNANISDIDRSLNDIRNTYKNSTKGFKKETINLNKKSKNAPTKLKKGDIVIVEGLGDKAEVISEPNENGDIVVQMGILKMNSNIKNVTKLKQESDAKKNVKKFYNMRKTMNISPTIDVRGQRVDEAINNISKYLDDAMLSGLKEVTIIHGKGTGALRKSINDFLENNRYIKSKRVGNDKEGGFGVTVCKLN